jgi:hypothetical protein
MIARFSVLAVFTGLIATPAWTQSSIGPAPVIGSELRDEVNELKGMLRTQAALLDEQRSRLERQQAEIDELRSKLGFAPIAQPSAASVPDAAQLARAVSALRTSAAFSALAPAASPHIEKAVLARDISAPPAEQQNAATGDSQLSIHFGKASLTPGGWVDFTAIYRSRDVGSGLGTAFASIPYSDTVQGGLSETRLTAQNSRITLRADENFSGTRVFGYAEADFNGVLPANAYVSTNSDSFRLRVYFTDLARGRLEFLGGQSWSLLTPNRVAISPFLTEIYNTLHLDSNYQVGLTYARQTQIRAVTHITPTIAFGVSAENPMQYSSPAATFPALFSTAQTDTGGGTATPTLHPDLIAKLAWDPQWLQRRWHFESSGLLTPVAILTPAGVAGSNSHKDVKEGRGIGAAGNLEVAPNLHLILTGFWSDGGGRYIGGLGPGFVVAQDGGVSAPFRIQLIHSGSGVAALEWRATPSTIASVTFSQAYFGRAWSTDPSSGKLVGYGFPGSPDSQNRTLHEATFATQTTLWRQPGYGSVQMITQSSWVQRAPWSFTPGNPKSAQVFSGWANLRYVLP